MPRNDRDPRLIRIEVTGDESVSRQARVYAEYRLFAALSQTVHTRRVAKASLRVHRANSPRRRNVVVCSVAVEFTDGRVVRVGAAGAHPYAAINRTVDRLRTHDDASPLDSRISETAITE